MPDYRKEQAKLEALSSTINKVCQLLMKNGADNRLLLAALAEEYLRGCVEFAMPGTDPMDNAIELLRKSYEVVKSKMELEKERVS